MDQSGTAYVGNIEYNTLHGNASQTTLSRIYNDEGYVENPASPQYYYFRHDHLGDNREVWLANTNTVAQRTQYYPSGLPWVYNRMIDHPDLQHRKYNNKEFVEMHGYDTYDIVWRQYYPAIGRFQTLDPEIEDAYAESPYSMCGNNMENRTDPDGRFWANIGGALLSGGLDYAGQVAGNLATGHSLRSALTENISVGSIVVSAVEGAINPIGGVSKAAAKAVAESTVKTIVKTTLKEATKSVAGQLIDNVYAGDKLGKNLVQSAVIGGVTGHLKISPNSPKANQTTRELTAALKNGKKLSVKQTERLAQAKTEQLGNELIKRTTDYVAGSNNKIITNIVDDKKKK